ncbi:MAG: hypothetical protein M1833_004618 [Piccolia ochrophora]|nr:MAG: hypothetical protein M1833_004618 [Piccolia ochrophora]
MASAATATGNPASPSSSPRLPSPPPFTEVQFGPQSPSISDAVSASQAEIDSHGSSDASTSRRIRPGTKAIDMASGPPLLDSPFQLQEHLKSLYYTHTHPANLNHTVPIAKETALTLTHPPEGVDRALWLYELCRLLTQELNTVIVAFFADTPPCSADKCPEMRASEWQYLCAVHDPPKPCCAIDYCCHTLDWASNMLTSPRHFPSRLTLGGDASGGSQQGMRNLTNVFRRLYRIFAHAWYQHRSVFWQVEGQTGLYVFFKAVCDYYQLIPEDNYTVPREAEGIEASNETAPGLDSAPGRKKDEEQSNALLAEIPPVNRSTTTRRHRAQPSTSSPVATVPELDEDDAAASRGSKGKAETPVPEASEGGPHAKGSSRSEGAAPGGAAPATPAKPSGSSSPPEAGPPAEGFSEEPDSVSEPDRLGTALTEAAAVPTEGEGSAEASSST